MSTHPNVLLVLQLLPDDLPMKTYRAILKDNGVDNPEYDLIRIEDDGYGYKHQVMENDYDEEMQLAAAPGSIVVYDMVTYGYGETIAWSDLEKRKNALEKWAILTCQKHQCGEYKIFVTANKS